MIDWLKYKFRSSQVGKLFSSKGDLTVTNKKALIEIYVQETFGVKKEISNKYFEKGIICEPIGRDLLQKVYFNEVFFHENTKTSENDYLTGKYDTKYKNIGFELKAAWDVFTFMQADIDLVYETQCKAYNWLWGFEKTYLTYYGADTPESLLASEFNSIYWKNGFNSTREGYEHPTFQQMCEDLRKVHTFSDKPIEQRLKMWEVGFERKDEDAFINRITKCRQWLAEYHEQQLKHQNNVLEIIKQSYEEIENQNTQAELF